MLRRDDDKTAVSKACFDELREHGHLSRYPFWETKSEGMMRGVILKGTRKDGMPKKTYAKKISIEKYYTSELDEFLAMTAANACGVLTPKIKLKSSGNIFYQFARDLSEPSLNTDSLGICFVTLKNIMAGNSHYELVNGSTAITRREFIETPKKHITIDKHSIAKIAIAALVFDFRDLHAENIGIVIDHTANTAKFAVIDVMAAPHKMPLVDLSKYKSISELIKNYPIIKNYFDCLPIDNLNDDDFIRALDDIAASMKNACSAITAPQENTSINQIIPDDHLSKKIANWERNLETLQLFVLNPLLAAKLR